MSERTNRRDLILDATARLFVEQGYSATSVRQIAEAVGCTEAALYYHFKDGKRELLQEVLEANLPDMISVLDLARDATSLHELIVALGQGLHKIKRTHVEKLRWLIAEYPKLTADERALVEAKQSHLYEELVELVSQFVEGKAATHHLVMTLMCAMFGYIQLMMNLNMYAWTGFTAVDLGHVLADGLANDQP
jgi:AcrR family transcriptional regulator